MRKTTAIVGGLFVALLYLVVLAVTLPKRTPAQATFAPFVCSTSTPISAAANTQIVTAANTSMYVYICSYQLGTGGTAETASIVEGTGTTCAGSTLAVAGGSTAAAGMPIGTSSLQVGGGVGWVLKTKVAGDNVCLFVSGAGPAAGYITSAQQSF